VQPVRAGCGDTHGLCYGYLTCALDGSRTMALLWIYAPTHQGAEQAWDLAVVRVPAPSRGG
jgi:hypothetical protein